MTDAFGLTAYLNRIGLEQRPPPTLATLGRIVAAHVAAIPFENVASFTGMPVDLAPAAVAHKLVDRRRGGYCYEQNGLLARALTALGFTVGSLMARVLWSASEDAVTPRSHKVLRVGALDGERLADVGFGGMTPTGPLRLEAEVEQATPLETFRLVRSAEEWRTQVRLGDDWRSLYRFDLTPTFAADDEQANWYTSTHPDSHFVVGLSAARTTADRRMSLRNHDFSVYHPGGRTEKRRLESSDAVLAVLDNVFHLTPPDPAALKRRLDSLPTD